MLKVAITGNIASGKSEVQKILEEKGYKVLDTDRVGHDVLRESRELKILFADYDVFDSSGNFSREKLGALVFSNPDLKLKLENVSHPLIKDYINAFFEEYKSEQIVFVAVPLLFEANMQDMFDKIILVYADDSIRKSRLIKRNNYSNEMAQIRIDSQISQDKKKNLCDFIILNNSTSSELKSNVLALLDKIYKIIHE